jgi:hypothetical protein
MARVFGLIIVTPFLLAWLLFCLLLAVVGRLLPNASKAPDLTEVVKKTTVCKVLNQKNLITDEEYEFETQSVAQFYDRLTFRGYLFVMAPFILLLRSTSFLDRFFQFLVRRWIKVHGFLIHGQTRPDTWLVGLAQICAQIAHRVGVVIHYLSVFVRLRVEI